MQYDRSFRSTQFIRMLEPVEGSPRLRIVCEPRLGWSKAAPSYSQGSNHLQFDGFRIFLWLITNIPLSYLSGQSFTLIEKRNLVLTWGTPIEESLDPLCEH